MTTSMIIGIVIYAVITGFLIVVAWYPGYKLWVFLPIIGYCALGFMVFGAVTIWPAYAWLMWLEKPALFVQWWLMYRVAVEAVEAWESLEGKENKYVD